MSYCFLNNGEENDIRIDHEDIKRGLEDLHLHQLHESRALPMPVMPTRFRGIPLTIKDRQEYTADLLLIGEDTLFASAFYDENDSLARDYAGIVLHLTMVDGCWGLRRVLHFGHHNSYMLPRPGDRLGTAKFKELLRLALG